MTNDWSSSQGSGRAAQQSCRLFLTGKIVQSGGEENKHLQPLTKSALVLWKFEDIQVFHWIVKRRYVSAVAILASWISVWIYSPRYLSKSGKYTFPYNR